ncbi:hypothetical protein [Pinisolibacter sp.]
MTLASERREAIEAALPYWREAQKSIESLVEFSEITALADQLSRLREN